MAMTDGEHERMIRLSGEHHRTVSVSISTTVDGNGRTEARTLVMKDLTETRRLEQQMQRNEKMSAMGELAAGVAHEIRNPLNAISMIAQRFEKEFVPKKDVREYKELTGVLKSESVRINGIIRQFLRFARPKAIAPAPVNALRFIENLSAIFRSQSKQKDVAFSVHAEELTLSLDAEQMTQACLNLLQNALDATPSGGSVSLSLHRVDDRIEIAVTDSGAGIPDAMREKIFDLYYTTKPNGTGMGLAITQQIVSQHSGSMRLHANTPSGSVFTISLPAAPVK
jgi:two-component system sensor histidine kinase HydH